MFELKRPEPSDIIEIRATAFSFQDIHSVIDSFYHQVPRDELLRVPFQSVTDWHHHIENLTHFWWTRFGGNAYLETSYDPVGKHFQAGFNAQYLERWLALFKQVLRQKLNHEQAQMWEAISVSMGAALSRNNELMKQRYSVNT